MADPKAKDAPKRLNMEARFDVAPAEVQGPSVESRGSTLYSDAGDKPPVTEGPAKPGAKAGAKSVSDLAYGSAEPVGAIAARTALRDNGGAEAIARVLQDHPTDRAAILREAEQLRGATFAADVQRHEQKATEKPHDDRPFAVEADASQTPDLKKQDERGSEIQTGQTTKQGDEAGGASAEGGVHQVQQVDTQMTE